MTNANPIERVTNVSSVPQRSPFRYPGGKTWLIPQIRKWMKSKIAPPALFFEPFLGGGIVSLTVGFESLAKQIEMVELDDEVAAVWDTVLSNHASILAKRILSFDLSIEAVNRELAILQPDKTQLAFNTILKNRTFHGGILAPGAGLLKHGENGNGIKSRWYPKTLHDRIMAIHSKRNYFKFVQGDGLELIRTHLANPNAVFFIDPPYTAGKTGKRAGKRLYRHSMIDHVMLFELASQIRGDFLMTYDNDPEVVELARVYGLKTKTIQMKGTHHRAMSELLVGNDLSWTDEDPSEPMWPSQLHFSIS